MGVEGCCVSGSSSFGGSAASARTAARRFLDASTTISVPNGRERRMGTALITGITGQDGRYLAEFLHEHGYRIFGLMTGQNNPKAELLSEEFPFVELVGGDLQDLSSLIAAIHYCEPDEIYNLGAISFVPLSFEQPELTANITGLGVLRLLEAIRLAGGRENRIKFYQASSSEMYGKVRESPQTEGTPFHPRSPYGAAKVFGHYITVNYREAYDIFACSGILFNHESPRRGREFVTRKVSTSVARIKLGLQDELVLGNLDARRDWGFAGDYVRAMWHMLQQDEPGDYLVATGETHSVRELVELAFRAVGIDDWEPLVKVDDRFLRPAEVDNLVGDATKARRALDWKPKVSFQELVAMMVQHDLELERKHVVSLLAKDAAA
jgi:GDPmannose 4,6-dehydratase